MKLKQGLFSCLIAMSSLASASAFAYYPYVSIAFNSATGQYGTGRADNQYDAQNFAQQNCPGYCDQQAFAYDGYVVLARGAGSSWGLHGASDYGVALDAAVSSCSSRGDGCSEAVEVDSYQE